MAARRAVDDVRSRVGAEATREEGEVRWTEGVEARREGTVAAYMLKGAMAMAGRTMRVESILVGGSGRSFEGRGKRERKRSQPARVVRQHRVSVPSTRGVYSSVVRVQISAR